MSNRHWRLQNTNWRQVDNSTPLAKIAIRRWLVESMSRTRTLETHGGGALMFERVWRERAELVEQLEGDAVESASAAVFLDYDIFDVDPYASPYETIEVIGARAVPDIIGIVATDGSLRRSAMMRTNISQFLCERVGFDNASIQLKAAIFHRYPVFCRQVLRAILPEWTIQRMAVKYASGGAWKQATAYFAVILTRVSTPGQVTERG